MLYHISKSILKNDSDCGDAVQETILKAYEKLPTLKKEKYFRTWITKILINECNGILRKRKNVIPYEEYMDNMKMTEEDRYSHLYMAIMELPEDLRVLVTLYYLEGFSQKEISEALDYYTCLLFSFTLIRCIRREIGSHKKFLMLRTKNKTQLNAVSYFLLACVRGFELLPPHSNPHRQ